MPSVRDCLREMFVKQTISLKFTVVLSALTQ